MKVMRFVGRTSRDAMRKLRDALGPDALVLANRPCAEGVELLAAAPGALSGLSASAARPAAAQAPAMASVRGEFGDADEPAPRIAPSARFVEGEVPSAGMSTVSFQDYVRQRLRERHPAKREARVAGGTAALAAGARAACTLWCCSLCAAIVVLFDFRLVVTATVAPAHRHRLRPASTRPPRCVRASSIARRRRMG
jgi:flagellar biosynthesis GTPase FlhF